jgi:hypothetical protein
MSLWTPFWIPLAVYATLDAALNAAGCWLIEREELKADGQVL